MRRGYVLYTAAQSGLNEVKYRNQMNILESFKKYCLLLIFLSELFDLHWWHFVECGANTVGQLHQSEESIHRSIVYWNNAV